MPETASAVDAVRHVRITDEFTVDVMSLALGFTGRELVPYRTRIERYAQDHRRSGR